MHKGKYKIERKYCILYFLTLWMDRKNRGPNAKQHQVIFLTSWQSKSIEVEYKDWCIIFSSQSTILCISIIRYFLNTPNTQLLLQASLCLIHFLKLK